MAQKVLIVEDDNNIAELLHLYLEKEGYETQVSRDGGTAVEQFHAFQPDLVLLDLMLPGLEGEEVLPRIQGIPVIIVSAKIDIDHKVDLLLGGAVDYVTKPFHLKELLARVAVHLRNASVLQDPALLSHGDLTLDTAAHTVSAGAAQVRLTRTEYALLKLLMQNPTQVITKSQFLDRICQDTPDCTESSLKMHISNLRRKLREAGGKDYIEAVWGIGFKLQSP